VYYTLRKLKEKFGDEVLSYFKLGGQSNLEIDFFNVLRFYYGNRIKLSHRIENRYYDYIIDDILLIEVDGTYWHSFEKSKINDKYKDELAIKYGYQLLRISEKEIKELKILQKIKSILNEIQISRYKKLREVKKK